MRRYARELDEIGKEQFSRVLSHDLYWKNKTYKLRRSIMLVFVNYTDFSKKCRTYAFTWYGHLNNYMYAAHK